MYLHKVFDTTVVCLLKIIREIACRKLSFLPMMLDAVAADAFMRAARIAAVALL